MKLEALLDTKPTFPHLKDNYFHVWNDNHQFKALVILHQLVASQ
jgi:hypothetical protein